MQDIAHLVQAAQAGGSAAYDALSQRLEPLADAAAYRALGDHHLTQELVQEAVIEGLAHLSQLKEPSAFPGWFRQIVFRQCPRVLRAAALPPPERLVMVLFYGWRCSYREVSALLQIPLPTVKKCLYTARQKLKGPLQAALDEARADAPRASDGAQDVALGRTMGALGDLVGASQAGLDAVLWGLAHPNARVRRGCAGFLDHHATDACMPQLQWVALHDPASKVRRVAVHAVTCQPCKPAPLSGDLVGVLVQVALEDPHRRVREKAIGGLHAHPPDARAVAALEQILRTEIDARIRRQAHHALKQQDPFYKARVDAEARARGIAAASARQEQHLLRPSSKAP